MIDMSTTRLKPDKCLACGRKLDSASHMTGDYKPKPDDVTICLRCGHLMAFDNNLRVRPLTSAEMHECAGNPEILRIQEARGKLKW